jgi:hypothetical protein
MKFNLILIFSLLFTSLHSQEILGFTFSTNDTIIKNQLFEKGFISNNNWKSARGKLLGKEVFFNTKSTQIFKNIYEFQLVFNTVFDSEKIFDLYKIINDSIIKRYNNPDIVVSQNDTINTIKNSFSKNISSSINYFSKWNQNVNRKFTLTTEIKSDANIYLTITDSSKYVSKKVEDSLLQLEINKEKIKESKNRDKLISQLHNSGLGIIILNYEPFDVSEYTEGTGFRINLLNPTKKIVKYINISFAGLNPVNDRVINKYGNSYVNSVRCVGPIKPLETGEYEWDYIWFNDLVQKIKILSISVEYMDGTKRVISDINKIKIENLSTEWRNFLNKNIDNKDIE